MKRSLTAIATCFILALTWYLSPINVAAQCPQDPCDANGYNSVKAVNILAVPGTEIMVPVYVLTSDPIRSVDLVVGATDPTGICLDGYCPSPYVQFCEGYRMNRWFCGGSVQAAAVDEAGLYRFGLASATGFCLSSEQPLVFVPMKLRSDTPIGTVIQIQVYAVFDDTVFAIPTPGLLTVVAPVVLGDVTGNGVVTATDAVPVLEHDVFGATLGPLQFLAADVDGSQVVDSYDGYLIVRKSVDHSFCFPVVCGGFCFSFVVSPVTAVLTPSPNGASIGFAEGMSITNGDIEFDVAAGVSWQEGSALDGTLYRSTQTGSRVKLSFIAGTQSLPDEPLITLTGTGAANTHVAGTVNQGLPIRTVGEVTAVDDDKTLPKVFALQQNYPNPFNPTTTIGYTLPKISAVYLAVYNMLGQEVLTLVSELQAAGTHSVVFKADNLPSGVYTYRLSAGEMVETKKMVLMK